MLVTTSTVAPFVVQATGTGAAQDLTAVGDAGHHFSREVEQRDQWTPAPLVPIAG